MYVTRPSMIARVLQAVSLLALLPGAVLPLTAQEYRAPREVKVDEIFHGMTARAIGPAGTSGRVAAIEVSPIDDRIIFIGAATGGVWLSTDGGYVWTPIMDDVPVNSIGAIEVSPPAPDIVWVGTGEANARNSMGVGRGVWKSLDGGETWTHMGLARSEHIEAIIAHPTDPDVAWVSAMGPAWSDGEERGIYKTTDGGDTWEKVLYVDETTGGFEVIIDPTNPEHLLASTWEFRREPWFMTSGGEGSGLWKSRDGGDTWKKLSSEDGLPEGILGRIGLAWATNDPNVVYALVEATESALLRSDDGGDTWRTVNTDPGINERAFYYSRVYVDPTNENRVYRVSGSMTRSEDGGRTFQNVTPFSRVHVDHHAFWTHPDGKRIITGNDGGVYFSNNRGDTWRFVENLPFSQFYHISVDNEIPYNVYGGLQDNGSWRGPSQVWETSSFSGSTINNHHWTSIGFGDGFAALIDPTDSNLGYSMSQGGNLQRFDLRTGEWNNIRPVPPEEGVELRFNWNAGIALDPFDPEVIYYGSQFVHRSPNRGEDWEVISPDLTTNDPEKQRQHESGGLTIDVTAAENHTTILTIAPSPVERGVIWVGTDDGNVQLTRDGGATWTNLIERIDGVPKTTWVPHIEASRHIAGRAYVVFDGHRYGDWTPYVFRTDNYGEEWEALSPDQIDGYVHVIEEDPVEPNLLFLGSEFGLHISLDAGETWTKFTHGGYPAGAPTRALVVHPRDHDLVVGTHGRGAWILDDIRPIRALAANPELADADLHLFDVPTTYAHDRGLVGPLYFPGDAEFLGENLPAGAHISYLASDSLAEAVAEERGEGSEGGGGGFGAFFGGAGTPAGSGPATIEIVHADTLIRSFKGPAAAGMNRTTWALDRKGLRPPDADADDPEPSGPTVLPGRYGVRVTLGDHTSEGSVEVRPDPRRPETPVTVVEANLDQRRRGEAKVFDVEAAIRRLNDTREVVSFHADRLEAWDGEEETVEALRAQTDSVSARISKLLDELRAPPADGIRADASLSTRLGEALNEATSTPYAPSQGRIARLDRAIEAADALLREVEAFHAGMLADYRAALASAGFDPFGGGSGG